MKKLGNILLPALLASCSHPQSIPRQEQQYSEMDLNPLFKKAEDANIVSFGTYHLLERRLFPYINHELETQRFYEDILPEMSRLGFKDLVLESLFIDIPQSEIDSFMGHGRTNIDSLLEFNLRESPDPNIEKIMEACRRLGINVHPAGIASGDYLLRRQSESHQSDDATRAAAIYELNLTEIETITENLKNKIDFLASEGNKVISLSGIKHNNCNKNREVLYDEVFEALTDDRREIYVSFGNYLYHQYGRNYLEVDLVAPETLDTIEVDGEMERIVNEMVPYEYMLLSIVSRGHGLIRYQDETENRLLTIFNITRNRTR